MVIDGITCCVGAVYAAMLLKSLPVWLQTLNSLTILMEESQAGLEGFELLRRWVPTVNHTCKLLMVQSNAFKLHGAVFNKGAALCEAMAAMYAHGSGNDWICHFDSDIIPPENWRNIAEKEAQPGSLYGAFRFGENGHVLDEAPLFPYGYFHLWHTSDPSSWRWPIFQPWHPHAGNYDSEFADQWLRNKRVELGFKLLHQGDPRSSWFGTDHAENKEKMDKLKEQGLLAVKLRARAGMDRLPLPQPKIKLCLQRTDPEWVVQALRACSVGGPFDVLAIVSSDPRAGFDFIDGDTSPEAIKQKVLAACSK